MAISRIAGVDEAGRGPLAGPVVVAAVILPENFHHPFLRDSKTLTRLQQEIAEDAIRKVAEFRLVVFDSVRIDELNILQATLQAMREAMHTLDPLPDSCLVDGDRLPKDLRVSAESVVKGDQLHTCISAASILAKTLRDRIMERYSIQFPEYAFDRHFGYATPAHLRALDEFGPCAIHRRSFEPVASKLLQPCLAIEN